MALHPFPIELSYRKANIMAVYSTDSILETIRGSLQRSPEDERSIVLMTSGLSGAGKTTLSKAVLHYFPEYHRLSIDEIIFEKHGLYGTDYAATFDQYDQYSEEADEIFQSRLQSLLKENKSIILDRAFYAKEDRDDFRRMVADAGGRLVLVYLRVPQDRKEALWDRICQRSTVKEANSALEIPRELFDQYWAGFEAPVEESELVFDVL